MRAASLVIFFGIAACGSVVDPAPPDDCTAGPELVPLGCGTSVALTASSVPEWLGTYECSGSDRLPMLEGDIDAARGDSAVTDALFAVVDATWTFDGTTASCTNALDTWFALDAVRALRDPNAFARLDSLVWRPLATPTFELEADEYYAAEAIACISTPEAQAEAQNIADHHPDQLVRQFTADRIQSQKCGLADF